MLCQQFGEGEGCLGIQRGWLLSVCFGFGDICRIIGIVIWSLGLNSFMLPLRTVPKQPRDDEWSGALPLLLRSEHV